MREVRFKTPDGAILPPEIAALLVDLPYARGEQPLANLCAIRDEANERLYRQGYVASVQIPPQEIADGTARLDVVLARLVDVRVSGEAGRYGRTLDARIAQLKALTPFNRFDAERILLLAGDVPGLDVALNLRRAGNVPGEVIGDLAVRYSPVVVVVNGQNSGSRAIGRDTVTARVELNGLTGLSDRTYVGASATTDLEEQRTLQAGHYLGDSRGRTAGVRMSYAWSRPDVGPLDIRSRSFIAGLDLSAPLIRSLDRSLNLGGGLELIDQRINLGGGSDPIRLTRDKLRVAFAILSGRVRDEQQDGGWAFGGSLELRRGLDVFDATKRGEIAADGRLSSRIDGDPTATVVRGGVDAVGRASLFSLAAVAQGQWANHPLLSIEEYSVGSLTLGRGYDPGIIGGDRALGLRVEPRVDLPVRNLGLQLFAFHDWVRIWNLDRDVSRGGQTLRSLGAGARLALPGLLSLEAIYAHPRDEGLSLIGVEKAPDRLLLSITAQFPQSGR